MTNRKSSPATPPPSEWLSLHAVALLFHQDQRTIKRRAGEGDFEMKSESGRYWISRESIIPHMRELEERHARRG